MAQATELLHGMAEIGEYLGLSTRQAKHLHETQDLPTFKMGRKVCALRSKLDEWLEQKAAGA